MSLRDFLRTTILGNSLLIPATNDFWELFKYEAMNSFMFLIYLLVLLVFIASSVWIGLHSSKKRLIPFALGFCLIFCAFIFQKLNNMDLEKAEKSSFLLEKTSKTESALSLAVKNFLRNTSNFYKKAEKLIGFDKKKFFHENEHKEKQKVYKKRHNEHDSSHNSNYLLGKNTKIIMCIPKRVNTKESLINEDLNENVCKDENEQVKKTDPSMKYLIHLHDVFLQHQKNSIEFKKYINTLSQLENKAKEELNKFKIGFDTFMKKGKVIESEMLGFNAPIRFLSAEYENLVNEIEKYFYLTKSYKEGDTNQIPLVYIENILKTRKILDSKSTEDIIKTDNISKHSKYIKVLVIIFIVILAINLVIHLLDISILEAFIGPCLCFICCLFFITSIFVLLDAQILDRNCKTGTVKDCNFDLSKTNDYIKNLQRTEFNAQSDIFKNDLEETLKVSEKRTKDLYEYTNLLMKDRLYEEINVFLNLFDKIVFVNEHFDELTENKIDSDAFYANINKMLKSLENFQNIFSNDLKSEALKLLTNEYKFCYLMKLEKDQIVIRARSIILGKPHRKSNEKIKNCLKKLENLCRTRDKLDIVFNVIVFVIPLILFSLVI